MNHHCEGACALGFYGPSYSLILAPQSSLDMAVQFSRGSLAVEPDNINIRRQWRGASLMQVIPDRAAHKARSAPAVGKLQLFY